MARAVALKKKPSLVRGPSPRTVSLPHEEIALRAYYAFLERGSVHGWDLDDWLQAERELVKESKKKRGRREKSELT